MPQTFPSSRERAKFDRMVYSIASSHSGGLRQQHENVSNAERC
jgi:hypothetical protein